MPEFKSDLMPWEKVIIDGDSSLTATVTAYRFRPSSDGGVNHMIEVTYMNQGGQQCIEIERCRLQKK